MAFDPFILEDVAAHKKVELDPREPALVGIPQINRYRFGYVASFTNSFVQLIDLDNGYPNTFERVVYTLGSPTLPKGSQ